MKVWSNLKSKLFGIHFGSIEMKIWGQSRAFDTYFWIQTLGGEMSQVMHSLKNS
jgi:hypothetical protein